MVSVSIIIPVYNVEQYIIACLNSVAAQTYTDYEVILIDDCGTDRSMALVDDFLKTSTIADKVLVLRHNQNRGLSAARNTGTSEAKGEYVYYLDSDDTISPDCLEKLARKAEETEADIVVGNICIVDEDNLISDYKIKGLNDSVTGNDDIFHSFLFSHYYVMAWNKLIRHDFLERNNISFVEGLIHEDQAWSFSLACVASKMSFIHDDTYNYLIRKSGIQKGTPFSIRFNAYCTLINYYEQEAVKYGKTNDVTFRLWYEKQKSFFFGNTVAYGTKQQVKLLYNLIRRKLPVRRLSKKTCHYLFPEIIGVYFYKKWHGLYSLINL